MPERPVQLDYLVYVALLVDIGFEQEYVRLALFEQAAVFDQSLDLRLPCFGELLDRKALETGSFVANALVLDIIESYPLELPPVPVVRQACDRRLGSDRKDEILSSDMQLESFATLRKSRIIHRHAFDLEIAGHLRGKLLRRITVYGTVPGRRNDNPAIGLAENRGRREKTSQ